MSFGLGWLWPHAQGPAPPRGRPSGWTQPSPDGGGAGLGPGAELAGQDAQAWPGAPPTSRQRGHSHLASSAAALGHTPSSILLRWLHKEGPLGPKLSSPDQPYWPQRPRPGLKA